MLFQPCFASSPLATSPFTENSISSALLLVKHGSFALLITYASNIAVRVMIAYFCLTESIQFLRADGVQIDWEDKGNKESNQRNTHCDMVALVIGHQTGEGREECTAGDGSHDPRGAALGMAAQATDREGEDGGEDAGFKEEDQGKHSDSAFATYAHCGGNEDDDAGQEDHEDPSGFDEHHGAGCSETPEGKKTLTDGIAVGSLGRGDTGTFNGIFDELGRYRHLCANIAELSGDAEE